MPVTKLFIEHIPVGNLPLAGYYLVSTHDEDIILEYEVMAAPRREWILRRTDTQSVCIVHPRELLSTLIDRIHTQLPSALARWAKEKRLVLTPTPDRLAQGLKPQLPLLLIQAIRCCSSPIYLFTRQEVKECQGTSSPATPATL